MRNLKLFANMHKSVTLQIFLTAASMRRVVSEAHFPSICYIQYQRVQVQHKTMAA